MHKIYTMIIGESITVRTVQGVGDILWVYQKLSPFFNEINIVVCVINTECPVQLRSLPFLTTLPKVKLVKTKLVTSEVYNELAKLHKTIEEVIKEYKKGVFPIEFVVNKPLEDGIRIDQIDNAEIYPIEETIPLLTKSVDLPYKKYLLLYISGNKIVQEWEPKRYAEVIKNTFVHFREKMPIILFGAEYDRKHLQIARQLLDSYGYDTTMLIGLDFKEANYIIKNASYFFGYQSGLNVIADQFDIPQTMLYFNFLGKMLTTWPKNKNINKQIYNAYLFENNIHILKNFYLALD